MNDKTIEKIHHRLSSRVSDKMASESDMILNGEIKKCKDLSDYNLLLKSCIMILNKSFNKDFNIYTNEIEDLIEIYFMTDDWMGLDLKDSKEIKDKRLKEQKIIENKLACYAK